MNRRKVTRNHLDNQSIEIKRINKQQHMMILLDVIVMFSVTLRFHHQTQIKVLSEQTREVNKLVKRFFGLCLILSGLGNIVVDFHF